MKELSIAKLASQCEEYYAEAHKHMKNATATVWDKEWLTKVSVKQAAYNAIAQFYQSRVCNANKSVGEEIARLHAAIDSFKLAQQRSADATLYQDYFNRAQKALNEAQKDNDFIYHERIPDVKTLEPIPKTAFVKVTPIPERLSTSFKGNNISHILFFLYCTGFNFILRSVRGLDTCRRSPSPSCMGRTQNGNH